jgi:lipopolysaccharide transport system ATP-binding protein
MSRPIILCDRLSKRYNLGAHRGKGMFNSPPSLREAVSDTLRAARSLLDGTRYTKPKEDHEFWALKDVSFQVGRGEVVGIVGRNGAGKSTLLKILSRIVEPSRGTIRLRGRLASLLEVGTGFHPELSGRENIYLNGAILGMCKAEIDRKFDEIVAFAEIAEFLDTPVKWYSSGMYVRLAFAVAAHLEPEILIVDEVLAVGDFSFQTKCLGKMHDVSASEGRTILFVSHNMGALSQLCSRGILLEKGRVAMTGSIHEVTKTYLESANAQHKAQTRFRIEPARPAQWLSAEVVHEDGTPGSEFSCDEPIKVRLRLLIRRPLADILVDFSIDTIDGIRVVFGDVRDGDPSIVERLVVGLHTFEIRIPAHVLSARTYVIAMAAYKCFANEHQNEIDFRPACFEFTMRDLRNMRQDRPGLLGLVLPWDHQYRAGIAPSLALE